MALFLLLLGGCVAWRPPVVPELPVVDEPYEYVADLSTESLEWVRTAGFRYDGGSVLTSGQSGEFIQLRDVWTDVEITTQVKIEDYGQYGTLRVHFGWQRKWNSYAVELTGTRARLLRYDGIHNQVEVFDSNTGVGLEPGRVYEVRVVVDGGQMSVFLDDELILAGSDPLNKYPQGYAGIEAGNDVTARVLSFRAVGKTVEPPAKGTDQYIADFSEPSSDWTYSGGVHYETGGISLRGTSGDAVLQVANWSSPDLEFEFTIDDYGQYGALRIVFGSAAKWQNYALQFNRTSVRFLRYDGNYDITTTLGVTSAFAAETGRRYRVALKVDGGVFQVFIDGERILSAMDYVTTYDVGKVGVEAGNDILGTVHSFLVRGTKVDV